MRANRPSDMTVVSKPVIVCDIDDVVFPFIPAMARHYNDAYKATLTPEDFISYNFNEVWGGSQEEANRIIEEFLSIPRLELRPIDGAVEAFRRLSRDFDIVMVTARNGIFESQTTVWLRAHFPELFREVIFAGNPHDGRGFRTKGEICKELGAVLIIDDYPANIQSAVGQGVDGILFGDRHWSVAAPAHEQVQKCADWTAVSEYIYGTWRQRQLS